MKTEKQVKDLGEVLTTAMEIATKYTKNKKYKHVKDLGKELTTEMGTAQKSL